MAENNTFDFGQDMFAADQVDTRTSPLESVPSDPPTKKGGYSFSADLESANQNSINDIYAAPPQSLFSKFTGPVGPSSISYAPEQLTDQYMYQEGFDARHFNPYDPTNYQKFADKETWGSALSKGFDSFGYKFGNTFTDYWKGYGRMAEALFTLDWDKMKPDEETMMNQYYQDQIDMKKNFVFEQPENEDSLFGKRTMSEFIGNAGFALGTFAGLGLEIAADVAITALTGGAGAETFALTAANQAARTAARQAAKEGIFGSARVFGREVLEGFGKLGARSVDDLRVLNKAGEAERIASAGAAPLRDAMSQTFEAFNHSWIKTLKSKSFAEFGENVLKGTPLLGTGIRYGERVAAAAKGGATAGQLTGLTLQGLRRVGQELNMSATEASFEAVTSYGDTLDKMMQQYKADNNGAVPTPEEFEKMRKLSMEASASNYNTNMEILLATNKIQFGTLFNKFLPASMIADDLAEQILRVEGKAAAAKLYKKGFAGTYGVLGQVAKDFGKKEALYQFGKAFAKDAFAFEIVEGLQENLQETTAAGWRDYYAGQMNGTKYTLGEAFGKGAEEQFSKQGLKTFLMGAFTGSIIRLPTAVASRSLDAANRAVINNQYKTDPDANPLKKSEKQFEEDIKRMNDLFKQAYEGKFEQKVVNFNAQMSAAQQTAQAAAQGSRYEFENGKDNALLSAVASAKRTNSIDMLYKAVKEMGTDMTAEEFEKSFGYKLSDTKYASAKEFSEDVARGIQKYSESIDNITSHVKKKLANPYAFADKSRGRIIAGMTRQAQEDAIQIIALNAVKGEMSANRAKQVASDILAMPGMANSADYAIRTLTNPKVLNTDLAFMQSELDNLSESLKAEGLDKSTRDGIKEQMELKQKEIDLFVKWKEFWATRKEVVGEDEDGNAITDDETSVFVGQKYTGKIQTEDENGNLIDEEGEFFSIDHPEVLNTFKDLMNIRNKQAGSDAEISEQTLRDSFEKIYDYMRLDQDTADYMRSVDQLLNPENYQRTVARILDGKLKYKAYAYLERLNETSRLNFFFRLKAIQDADTEFKLTTEQYAKAIDDFNNMFLENESYKNLLAFISNKDMGIENDEYVQKLVNEISEFAITESKKILEELTGVQETETTEPVTAEEPVAADEQTQAPGTEAFENAPVNGGDQEDQVTQTPGGFQADQVEPGMETFEGEVETLTPVEPTPVETPAEQAPIVDASEQFNESLPMADDIVASLIPQEEPFTVTGTPDTGFDVVDRNNNPVTNEKIESQEKAQELSDSLNETRTNQDFIKGLLLPLVQESENKEQLIINTTERAEKSLDRYNKRTESDIKTLEDYYKVPEGRKAINRLTKSAATGKPMEAEAEKPVIIEPTGAEQLQLFDTTTTPSNSASLTLESLQALHSKIQGAISAPEMQQISEKNSKFVEGGIVTEESILDELRKITECFS